MQELREERHNGKKGMKYKRYKIEAVVVLGVVAVLAWVMIPRFLAVQNINTPHYFPDPEFRKVIELFMKVETGGRITRGEAAAKTGVIEGENSPIHSSTGIELFPKINGLRLNLVGSVKINLKKNTQLEYITIKGGSLEDLDLSRNKKLLSISLTAKISHLDLSHHPELALLWCNSNQLKELDLSHNPELFSLFCANNQITHLDLSHNSHLKTLECWNNQITELDLRNLPLLRELKCSANPMERIYFPSKSQLKVVNVHSNRLEQIDLSTCLKLEEFWGKGNRFAQVPDFFHNPLLVFADLSKNRLDEEDCADIQNMKKRLGDLRYVDEGPRVLGFVYQPQANGIDILCGTE